MGVTRRKIRALFQNIYSSLNNLNPSYSVNTFQLLPKFWVCGFGFSSENNAVDSVLFKPLLSKMLYIIYCHHKLQEKQEDFCISSQAFLSPCEDRATNVSCGNFGSTWPASSAIPYSFSRETQQSFKAWEPQVDCMHNLINILSMSQYFTGRALCHSLTGWLQTGCYTILWNLQITIIQIQRPQTVNK